MKVDDWMLEKQIKRTVLAATFAAVIVLGAACSTESDAATDDPAAINAVRDYLAVTPIEGEFSNGPCIGLIERDGPRSVQWTAQKTNDRRLLVEALRGGEPVRDFGWLYNPSTREVVPLLETSIC